MLFSCKITSSVLSYLERQGEDVTLLLEATPMPEEFLKDPSYWMQSQDLEKFLAAVTQLPTSLSEENILQKIGLATPELRSWGVLDSVLRMMSLTDVLAQPTRFLSYFISPEPPIDNLQRSSNSLAFDLPVPADQFPYTATYLQAAFSTLPIFGGREPGICSWKGIHFALNWDTDQARIFKNEETAYQISPELMRSIVEQLEKHQLELQQKNAELEARNEQLRKAYVELESDLRKRQHAQELPLQQIASYDFIEQKSIHALQMQVARLGDYMVRSQQLITLLVGGNRLNPAIKTAMKRVDWEWVKQQFPLTMATCFEILQKTADIQKTTPVSKDHERTSHV